LTATNAASVGAVSGSGGNDRIPIDDGGKDDGGLRGDVGGERIDDLLEVGDVADGDLDDKAFGAGDAMALADFGNAASDGGEALELVAGDGDFDEGAERKADGGGVDLSVVAADGADVFEFANTLDDGRGGKGDAAAEFGKGKASVGLQLCEQSGVDGVEPGDELQARLRHKSGR